jgi:hypothetical protein
MQRDISVVGIDIAKRVWKRNKKVAIKPRPHIRTADHALLCPSR